MDEPFPEDYSSDSLGKELFFVFLFGIVIPGVFVLVMRWIFNG